MDIARHVGARVQAATGPAPSTSTRPRCGSASRSAPTSRSCSPATRDAPGGLPGGRVRAARCCCCRAASTRPSPGWLAAKRGLALDAIYFHSPPYIGEKSRDKVLALGKQLARWQALRSVTVVPFTDVQKRLRDAGPAELAVVLYRRMMMRIADAIADQLEADALVTGENLGQVASQTIENLTAIEAAARRVVLRPAGHLRQGRDHRARAPHRHLRDVDPALRGLLLAVRADAIPRRARAPQDAERVEAQLDVAAEIAAAVAGSERIASLTSRVHADVRPSHRRTDARRQARRGCARSSPATARRWSASRAASIRRCCCASRTTCSAIAASALTAVSITMAASERARRARAGRRHRRAPRGGRIARAGAPRLRAEPDRPLLPLQGRAAGDRARRAPTRSASPRCCSAPTSTTSAITAPACAPPTSAARATRWSTPASPRPTSARCRAAWACRPGTSRSSPACRRASPTAPRSPPSACARSTASRTRLRALGFRQLRVRYHGEVARLEIDVADMPRALEPGVREAIVALGRAHGLHVRRAGPGRLRVRLAESADRAAQALGAPRAGAGD